MSVTESRPLAINHINYKKLKHAAIFSLAAIFAGGIFTLHPFTPESSYASTHTDSASGAYNGTTYSLSTSFSDLELELHALPSGNSTYGAQTVSVTTNAPGGYQLYVNTSGVLTNGSDNSTIPSVTGTNVALSTNTWGYTSTTPNEDGDTAGNQTIWNTVPTTLTQIDSSSSTVTNKEKTLYYGVKADNTLTDGTYTGTITYTTVANDAASDTLLSVSPTSGTAGAATTITITTSLMTTTDGITASDISAKVGSYTCSSVSITSRAPLKFTCNTSASLTAGSYTVTATISKYNKTYTKSSAFTVNTPTMDTVTYMQDVTQEMCYNADSYDDKGVTYTLRDKRDNSTYQVRKLKDGNCWMTQNLRLVNKTISSNDSNITSTSSFTIPASSTNKGTTSGTWGTTGTPDGVNHTAAYYGNNTTYGAYYNWYTATAGTGTWLSSDLSVAPSSICPKSGSGNVSSISWHLPTGRTGEWYRLMVTSYGYKDISSSNIVNSVKDWTATAINLPFSGGFNGSVLLRSDGVNGEWWSSTATYDEVNNAYVTFISDTGYLYAGTSELGYKYEGYPIRCLLTAAGDG